MSQPYETPEAALSRAREQLPAAFAVGGTLPFNEGATPLGSGQRVEGRPDILDDILPRGDEDLRDLSEQNKELGFDAIAFYVSFHKPAPDGKWGIFYYDNRIRQLAQGLRHELKIGNRMLAGDLAFEIVRRHELFHFRFDVFALHQELTIGQPLYNDYHENVYLKVVCTSDCFEEAMANRACVRSDWSSESAKGGVPAWEVTALLKRWCLDAPPGYRDFDRSERELRCGLGGQLLHRSSSGRLLEPQSRWVGNAGPFERRACCPEHVFRKPRAVTSEKVQFRKKTGKHIWDFHRYDPDPWPSTPHGHDRETGWKLSIKNGKIYDPRNGRNAQPVGQEGLESIIELRRYIKEKWPELAMDPLDPVLASRAEMAEA